MSIGKEVLRNVFSIMDASKKSSTSDYSILDTESWINSEYFVSNNVDSLFKCWRDFIPEIFNGKRDTLEVLLTGGMGTGKTTAASLMIARVIYELSRMPDVHEQLGLKKGSKIIIAYLTLSRKMADLTGFDEIRTNLDSIPYFKNEFPRNMEKNSILEFPNGITVLSGSDTAHVIGTNLIACILDEVNFWKEGGGNRGDLEKIQVTYNAIKTRIASRFASGKVKYPGITILVSSSSHDSSFTEKIIEKCPPTTKVISLASWEAREAEYATTPRFVFFRGTESYEPKIVETLHELSAIFPSENIPRLPVPPIQVYDALPIVVKQYLLKVPDMPLIRQEFKTRPLSALTDLAGVPAAPKGRLFTSTYDYSSCMSKEAMHPFSLDEIVITTRGKEEVKDFLILDRIFKNGKMRIAPDAKRYIHIDQSVSGDSTGISIVHINKVEQTKFGRKPIIFVDLMLRINPPQAPDKISIDKCKRFIVDLRDMGMRIGRVTYDQYQSTQAIQLLQSSGIEAGNRSVDRSDEDYLTLSEFFLAHRMMTYPYEPFRRELFTLLHDRVKRKVDHPGSKNFSIESGDQRSTKDVADSLCGAVANAKDAFNEHGGENSDYVVKAMEEVVKFQITEKPSPHDLAMELYGHTILTDEIKVAASKNKAVADLFDVYKNLA